MAIGIDPLNPFPATLPSNPGQGTGTFNENYPGTPFNPNAGDDENPFHSPYPQGGPKGGPKGDMPVGS